MALVPLVPNIIPVPFGHGAQRTTIPTSSPSANSSQASWTSGFPPITMINKQAGGKPPLGQDFNSILYELSSHAYFSQSGCVYPWVGADSTSGFPGLNYLKGSHVLGSNGEEYIALHPSGPDVPASNGSFVGPIDPVGDTTETWIKAKNFYRGYELCEFYFFRSPTRRQGFEIANGGLLENAAKLYPQAWAYLQTSEGQQLCKTEEAWQAMTRAIWHTNADGTTVGWNGIGGAPFYALHTDTGALRLPDLRGMYAEAAGFDSLRVGDVHGDGIREIVGSFSFAVANTPDSSSHGAFLDIQNIKFPTGTLDHGYWYKNMAFYASRVVPTAAKNQPRAYCLLPCVYLGQPAS